MDKVETENVELRKLLNAVVGTWTDEKQMAGILCLHDKIGNGSKLPTTLNFALYTFQKLELTFFVSCFQPRVLSWPLSVSTQYQ